MSNPAPEWKSLDTVRQELDIERELQANIADSADSRAGVILGFAGALAALAISTNTLLALPGAVVATVSAVAAAGVLWPRARSTMDPRYLRRTYVARDHEETKKAALDRRVQDYESNKDIAEAKIGRLKFAIGTLASAIVLTVTGVTVRMIIDAVTK